MSEMNGRGAQTASLRRVVVFGAISMLGPLVIGVLFALTQPGRHWRVEGVGPFLAICLGLVAFAAGVAAAARTAHVAVGTMTGVALAIGSIVREGSAIGALIALAAGAAGGVLANTYAKRRMVRPDRAPAALAAVAIVLALPVGLLARVDPVDAALSYPSGRPALAWATSRFGSGIGYVLVGRADQFLEGATLVSVVSRGIGSWAAQAAFEVPRECQLPSRVDGADLPWVSGYFPFRDRYTGVLVQSSEITRVCWLLGERVVVGVAPQATTTIEALSSTGRAVPVQLGVDGAYVFLLEEYPGASLLARIVFRDAKGRILDSKPLLSYGEEYIELAMLSGIAPANASSETEPEHSVIVSIHLVSADEFRTLCKIEPPYGDGLVSIAIVRRDDGVTREVVRGSGTPLSSAHPEPDPPLVRPSNGRPCFAPG